MVKESHCRRPSSIQLSISTFLHRFTTLYVGGTLSCISVRACVRVEERDILFIIHLFFFKYSTWKNAREIEDIKKKKNSTGRRSSATKGGLGKKEFFFFVGGCLSCDRTLFITKGK